VLPKAALVVPFRADVLVVLFLKKRAGLSQRKRKSGDTLNLPISPYTLILYAEYVLSEGDLMYSCIGGFGQYVCIAGNTFIVTKYIVRKA
jgi:hypothetical protein